MTRPAAKAKRSPRRQQREGAEPTLADLLQVVQSGFEGLNQRLEAIAELLCARTVEGRASRFIRTASNAVESPRAETRRSTLLSSLGDIGCDNSKQLLMTFGNLPEPDSERNGRKWRERSRETAQ